MQLLKMRGATISAESVLFLMGSVAMEKEYNSYKYPVSVFRYVDELKRKFKNKEEVKFRWASLDFFFIWFK